MRRRGVPTLPPQPQCLVSSMGACCLSSEALKRALGLSISASSVAERRASFSCNGGRHQARLGFEAEVEAHMLISWPAGCS
jgi:hypothetical protein